MHDPDAERNVRELVARLETIARQPVAAIAQQLEEMAADLATMKPLPRLVKDDEPALALIVSLAIAEAYNAGARIALEATAAAIRRGLAESTTA